ncbi:hypothetical protein ACSBR1_023733 [Camellia fascicularis]
MLGQLFNQMILIMFPISSQETSGLFLYKIVFNFICGNSSKISTLVGVPFAFEVGISFLS